MDSGLQFDFSYASGTSWDQMVAFETAGMMWSDYISDDMTVNIHVEMTNALPENVIGGALPAMETEISYANFRDAYEADITSWHDQTGFDSLSFKLERGVEKFDARVNLGAEVYLEDSSSLNMTRANAKALGMIAGDESSLDGYILMNDLSDSSVNWNYDSASISDSSLDFLSVAVHEIGHVLGFVSGLDRYDAMRFAKAEDMMSYFNNDLGTLDRYTESVVDNANPLDLFRYSNESLAASTEHNVIEMSIGTKAFFGPAKLWHSYATGKDINLSGDGFQASHWQQKSNNVQGIMDPLIKPGVIRRISNRDIKAMDYVGYDLNTQGRNLMNSSNVNTNWQPVTGKGTSLSTLEHQSKKHVAQDLHSWANNGTVDWWINNGANYAGVLTENRTNDVQEMIDKSMVYEGRRSTSGRTRYRQEAFWQAAYFSQFSWQEFQVEPVTAMTSLLSMKNNSRKTASKTSTIDAPTSTIDVNESDRQDKTLVSHVTMNLLSIEDSHNFDNVMFTGLQTELVAQDSLYQGGLSTSELVMTLK